jgi:site-specific recombinase XerD
MAVSTGIKKAGSKDFRIHELRHTYATRLIENGLSLNKVSVVHGHSDPAATVHDSHLDNTNVPAKVARVSSGLNK